MEYTALGPNFSQGESPIELNFDEAEHSPQMSSHKILQDTLWVGVNSDPERLSNVFNTLEVTPETIPPPLIVNFSPDKLACHKDRIEEIDLGSNEVISDWLCSGDAFEIYAFREAQSHLLKPREFLLTIDIRLVALPARGHSPTGIPPGDFYRCIQLILSRGSLAGIHFTGFAPSADTHGQVLSFMQQLIQLGLKK